MYRKFSLVYDEMMAGVDYQRWADYVYDLASPCRNIEKILDIACGTGNLTFALAKKGCDVTGIDVSSDMIAIARAKLLDSAEEYGEYKGLKEYKVRFLVQDMRMIDLEIQYDLVVCACDGMNYLLDINDLRNACVSVRNVLHSGGVFIFDISSEYKLREIIGDNTFTENFVNSSYIWENCWDEEKKLSYQNLTIFYRKGQMYEKIEEQHIQKAHSEAEISDCLLEQGFSDIRFYDAFSLAPAKKDSERFFVFARKLA
jgi:SAM-dependent methyltransferase